MKQGNHIFHMHVAKKEKTEENQMEKKIGAELPMWTL